MIEAEEPIFASISTMGYVLFNQYMLVIWFHKLVMYERNYCVLLIALKVGNKHLIKILLGPSTNNPCQTVALDKVHLCQVQKKKLRLIFFVTLNTLSSRFSHSLDSLNHNPDVAREWLVNPFTLSRMYLENFKTSHAFKIE